MKILHLTDSLTAGGKERQLVELLKSLSKNGDVICELATMSTNDYYGSVKELGIKIHYLIRQSNKDLRIFAKLWKLCKKHRPDIIHSWNSMCSVYAVPIAKMLGIKLINGFIRSAPSNVPVCSDEWIRAKLTFPFSDAIVSNSYAGMKPYRIPRNKRFCMHDGFDFDRIKHLENKALIRRRLKIESNRVVGMVASFSDRKDYDTFISSAQGILQQRDDVTFLAIGDGQNLERCSKLIEMQYQNKILFLGLQQNVESLINVFDVGVLLTNTKVIEEGISNSIIEYMALGKPVIATNRGGTGELVLDKETGFLVEPFDPKCVSNKIMQLLNDKALLTRMGQAGMKRIVHSFKLEEMTDKYIELYRKVLAR